MIEKKVIIRKITQKYSMDKLMMMLDKKKLEALEEEFSHHPDGIKLGNFVWLMKAAITHNEEDKFDLVHGLLKLFAEIDINGDEHMEWSEFTQYIIDAVIQNPSIKGSGAKGRDLLQETKMMKYKKYFPSRFKDKTSHNSWTKSVVWCPKFQSLMVIENNQKQIKLLDPDDLQPKFIINLPPQKKEVFVIDIDYSNEHQTFGCIDSDCNMIFWDYFINLKICKQIKSPCLQLKLKYLRNHKTWLTIGQDNIIREYDLRRPESLILQVEGHTKQILDLIELQSPFAIASASLDHTIRIYSLVDKESVSVLSEHVKGVRSLSYNPNFGGFILSVGFERNVYVWSPEVTQKKSLIGKLEGHTEIVVCAKFLNLKPFCVSIDEKFNFRFWDVRNLTCVQVITNEINSQVPIYGIFMFPSNHEMERFAVLSKRLLFYDIKKKEGQNQQPKQQQDNRDQKFSSDQSNPIMAEFNKYYLNFSIVTPQDIRIYNAKDGKLQKIIQNIVDPRTKAPITAFCSDDRQRKFYIGDSSGGIRTYNISNGVFIKEVQKPFSKTAPKKFDMVNDMDSHEISSLHYLHLENHNTCVLVTSSWDSALQIYDEGEQPDESHMLRLSVGGHGKEDISCMTVCADLALIATGSISGIVAIWDFETSKIENYCLEHQKSISSLFFLNPLSVLISTCQEGYACIWGLRQAPFEHRYKLLKKIRNVLEDPESGLMKANITCSKTKFIKIYQKDNAEEVKAGVQIKETTQNDENGEIVPIMMLGDDSGYVNYWSFSSLMKELRDMGFKDVPSIPKYQLSFNPKKNAQLNLLSASRTQIFFAEQKARKVNVIDSQGYCKRKQWFAHSAQLNSITFLENPDGILTCSQDRHVKLWSLEGELWGDINLLREKVEKHWNYPLDWSEKKAREIEKVKRLMQIVDPFHQQQVLEQATLEAQNSQSVQQSASKSQSQAIAIDETGEQQPKKTIIVEEKIIFEQAPKKERDQRELIDYLAKRQRRMDLEENQKRQHERQVMLQNQEQMRAQYVSQQMKYSENVYMDKFLQDVQKATDENFMGQMMKNSVINIMDQRFDGLIEASLQGETIKDIIIKSEGLANLPNAPIANISRSNTYNKRLSQKQESSKNLPQATLTGASSLQKLGIHNGGRITPIVHYPKPIVNKKDMNKEFNQTMFTKVAGQAEQLSNLLALTQMDQKRYQEQKEKREAAEGIVSSPPKSALRQNMGSQNASSQKPSSAFTPMSQPNRVTFNESQMSQSRSDSKFAFFNPSQQQPGLARVVSNPMMSQYVNQLKPFSPISNQQTPQNMRGVLQNLKNTITYGNLADSINPTGSTEIQTQQMSSGISTSSNGYRVQSLKSSKRKQAKASTFRNSSHQYTNEISRPYTSQAINTESQSTSLQVLAQKGAHLNALRVSHQDGEITLSQAQMKDGNKDQIVERNDLAQQNHKMSLKMKTNKIAEFQKRQTEKIVAMAQNIANHADKLEYQIKKDYQRHKEYQDSKDQQREMLASAQIDRQSTHQGSSNQLIQAQGVLSHSKSQKNMRNSDSNFYKSPQQYSQSNTQQHPSSSASKRKQHQSAVFTPKQRRCIIGFEGGGGSASQNSKFLRKLNNFLSQANGPQSQIEDQVANIRYQKGEGVRLLKLNYNKVQFENDNLKTQEYGYKRVEPDPILYNIFKGKYTALDPSNIPDIQGEGNIILSGTDGIRPKQMLRSNTKQDTNIGLNSDLASLDIKSRVSSPKGTSYQPSLSN